MGDSVSNSLVNDITKMAQLCGGQPFPYSAVDELGGWSRLTADATTLVNEPVLPIVANLIARDSLPGDEAAADATIEIVAAVTATTQPAILNDSLEALLSSSVVIQVAGEKLATELEPLVRSFLNRKEPDPIADLRSAVALEAMTRLVAVGCSSHFSLLGLLQKFTTPIVTPMSRAVIRSISTAIDLWTEAESLVCVVRKLGGLDAGEALDDSLSSKIESDVAWVLAMASLMRSLRAMSVKGMTPHIEEATKFLHVAVNVHQRHDAAPLLGIVEALQELINGVVSNDAVGVMSTSRLSTEVLNDIREQILRFSINSSGLDHWYSDNKIATFAAWTSLIDDLDTMGTQLVKDGFYQAEVVIRNLLTIYIRARTFRIGAQHNDLVGMKNLVQPVINEGFARNASHLSNLEEYVTRLELRETETKDQDRVDQIEAAQTIIRIARHVAVEGALQEKDNNVTQSKPLPRLLNQIVPLGSADRSLVTEISPATLEKLEQQLDFAATGRSQLNLTQQELFDDLRQKLSASPDYKDDVVIIVDQVLLLIINFVASRTGSSAGHYQYLFDKNAKEDKIHEDLYNYLVGNLGSQSEYEVSHVGGGRVDIRLKFSSFALHIEIKVDTTMLPLNDRTAYIKQAVTYQNNDVRIGFLVALRHKAFDQTGPPPHIKSLIEHTTFEVINDPEPRHMILVSIPGSRINPSSSK